MGGRKDYSSKSVVGSNRLEIRQDIDNLKLDFKQQDTSKAVNQLLTLAIHSDQTLQAISISIKLIKLVYKIYQLTEEEFEVTGNFDTALSNAILTVVEQKLENKKQIIVEEAVKFCWNEVKDKYNISSPTSEIDKIVIYSVTETLLESIG